MSSEEKTVWIRGVVAIVAYTVYLIIVIPLLGAAPLSDIPYVAPFLWSIGGAIVASIVLHILFVRPEKKDQRDREIYRFGETVGQAFVVIGGVSAMLLALFEFEYFWIANVIYLCFVLSAILSASAKLVAYRSGMPRW